MFKHHSQVSLSARHESKQYRWWLPRLSRNEKFSSDSCSTDGSISNGSAVGSNQLCAGTWNHVEISLANHSRLFSNSSPNWNECSHQRTWQSWFDRNSWQYGTKQWALDQRVSLRLHARARARIYEMRSWLCVCRGRSRSDECVWILDIDFFINISRVSCANIRDHVMYTTCCMYMNVMYVLKIKNSNVTSSSSTYMIFFLCDVYIWAHYPVVCSYLWPQTLHTDMCANYIPFLLGFFIFFWCPFVVTDMQTIICLFYLLIFALLFFLFFFCSLWGFFFVPFFFFFFF